MPPIVHIVRHGQAKSNVDPAARHSLDPGLTSEGIKQAHDLGLTFPFHDRIETVFASPLQRALHTALIAFGGKIDVSNKIIALPSAQETSHAPCDTGHDVEVLEKLFPSTKIDYRYLSQDWNSKTGPWSQDDSAVKKRATGLRDFLAARPEREVVLITHGFFLHFLTEDWSELESNADWCGFKHCECRTYSLEAVEGQYRLCETAASRLQRA